MMRKKKCKTEAFLPVVRPLWLTSFLLFLFLYHYLYMSIYISFGSWQSFYCHENS